jgi:hypothetical protein
MAMLLSVLTYSEGWRATGTVTPNQSPFCQLATLQPTDLACERVQVATRLRAGRLKGLLTFAATRLEDTELQVQCLALISWGCTLRLNLL